MTAGPPTFFSSVSHRMTERLTGLVHLVGQAWESKLQGSHSPKCHHYKFPFRLSLCFTDVIWLCAIYFCFQFCLHYISVCSFILPANQNWHILEFIVERRTFNSFSTFLIITNASSPHPLGKYRDIVSHTWAPNMIHLWSGYQLGGEVPM